MLDYSVGGLLVNVIPFFAKSAEDSTMKHRSELAGADGCPGGWLDDERTKDLLRCGCSAWFEPGADRVD